eukprot:m.87804 g.87804  ORF g.87804 m.87804 type:complete len:135 (+) comp12841_c0_seq7:310-714(+)
MEMRINSCEFKEALMSVSVLFVATVLFLSLVEMDWVTFVIVGICGPIVVATFLPETQVCTLNRNGPATWTATTLLQTYAGIAPRVNVFSAPVAEVQIVAEALPYTNQIGHQVVLLCMDSTELMVTSFCTTDPKA